MDIHIGGSNHPDATTAADGLGLDDPYFHACWAPLLDPWTTHAFAVSARIVRARTQPVRLTLDQFSKVLNPAPASFQVRARTVGRALQDAAAQGLAAVRWQSHVRVDVTLYRQLALVPHADLTRLTDPELSAHASTVSDLNRRRAVAGRPLLTLPPTATDRLRRADPSVRPATPDPVEAALAQLEGLSGRAPTGPDALTLG